MQNKEISKSCKQIEIRKKTRLDIQMLIDKIILLHWKWFYLYLMVCSWSIQIPFIKKGVLNTHFIKKWAIMTTTSQMYLVFFLKFILLCKTTKQMLKSERVFVLPLTVFACQSCLHAMLLILPNNWINFWKKMLLFFFLRQHLLLLVCNVMAFGIEIQM